jgi:hypothetical protein
MELMAYVEGYQGGQLVPFFALCLFAGIRPCLRSGEILKIKAKDTKLSGGVEWARTKSPSYENQR